MHIVQYRIVRLTNVTCFPCPLHDYCTADTRGRVACILHRSQGHALGRWMALSSERTRREQSQDPDSAAGALGGEPSSSTSGHENGSNEAGNAGFEFYDPRGLFARRRSTLNSDGSRERAALRAESARATAATAGSSNSSAILSPASSVADFTQISNGSYSPIAAGSIVRSISVALCPASAEADDEYVS